jgi:hypothetical protein
MLFSKMAFLHVVILKLERLIEIIIIHFTPSAIDACLTFKTCMVFIHQQLKTSDSVKSSMKDRDVEMEIAQK